MAEKTFTVTIKNSGADEVSRLKGFLFNINDATPNMDVKNMIEPYLKEFMTLDEASINQYIDQFYNKLIQKYPQYELLNEYVSEARIKKTKIWNKINSQRRIRKLIQRSPEEKLIVAKKVPKDDIEFKIDAKVNLVGGLYKFSYGISNDFGKDLLQKDVKFGVLSVDEKSGNISCFDVKINGGEEKDNIRNFDVSAKLLNGLHYFFLFTTKKRFANYPLYFSFNSKNSEIKSPGIILHKNSGTCRNQDVYFEYIKSMLKPFKKTKMGFGTAIKELKTVLKFKED